MSNLLKQDLLDRLTLLDEEASLLFDDDSRFHLVIVGGSGLVLLETITRSTHDIDALDLSHELLDLLEKYDINCRVQTYINNYPYNYEDRLVPIPISGKKIDFYTASLEDIVVAKLYSMRPVDRQDIISPEVVSSVDWDRLAHLALSEDEARASALNERRYKDFLADYEEYVKRYRI